MERLAKSIGPVSHVCQQFEKELGTLANKDYHSTPSFRKEFRSIVSILKSEGLLSNNCTCSYASFDKESLFQSLNWIQIESYVKEKIINLDLY